MEFNYMIRPLTKFNQYSRTNESFEEIWGGCYECDLINQPKTVLDIGANEGAFTAWALEKWPSCRITAFEPVSDNADVFNVNHGGNSQVEFHQKAVSTKPTLEIHLGKNNSGDCSAYDIGDQLSETVKAECVSPDLLPSCEFVKVDTEGCELEIISGLDLSKTTALVCEWHRDDDCRKIIEVAAKAGLKLFHCKPWFKDRGEMGFARPGARKQDISPEVSLPDETRLSGNTKDGKLVSTTAGNIRNEHYDPRLKGMKLFIGLPVYSTMVTQFVQCLMEFQAQKPCPVVIHIGQGDGVARTRNVLTAAFLKSDCTHMLLMDCDLIWNRQHVIELMLANKPLIGGFYPKKQQGPLEWVVNSLNPTPPPNDDHTQPLKYVGTGFMCINREVFEKMIAAYPEIKFREDYGNRDIAYDFWSMGVYRELPGMAVESAHKILRYLESLPSASEHQNSDLSTCLKKLIAQIPSTESRYLSEDWFFCQRWLDIGGECLGHTRVAVRHVGPVIFPLDTQMPEVANPKPN